MTATTPTSVVQVAPGFGPLVDLTDGQWVTLTSSAIVDCTFQHGRQSEFDTFNAGTLTVTFEDRTRVFDPLNASGAYYGNLNPGMQIRVRGFISPTYYPRWRGFVESIVTTNARTTTFVTLTCSDAFKILNQSKLPESVYETLITAATPLVYWPLGEADGTTAADLSGNDIDGTYSTARGRQHSSRSLVPYSSSGSLDIVEETAAALVTSDGAVWTNAGSTPMTFECWVQCDVDLGTYLGTYVIAQQGHISTTGDRWTVAYNPISQTTAVLQLFHGSATNTFTKFDIPRLDLASGPHHIAVGITSAGVASAYCDGVALVVNGTAAVAAPLVRQKLIIGCDAPDASFASWLGQVAHVAVYDVPPATVVADHYDEALAPWDSDTTGERFTRILDLIGWPAGLRSLDSGEKVLGPADLAGMTALQYLQLVGQSEGGRFFIDKSGDVTFHDAGRFLRETVENTSQYTFSDDEAGDAVYAGGNFSRDDTQVYNQASIQRKYGLPQTAEDTTSVQNFGPRTYTLTGLLHKSDAIAKGLAEATVYRYKDPQSRVTGLTVQPQVDAGSWPNILALEIGQRVTVEQKPANQGTQIQLPQHVEQITESINGDVWTLTFLTSPTDPHEAAYLIFDGVGATQGFDVGVFR